MNLFSQLLISVIAAGAAAALILQLNLAQQPILLIAAVVLASCLSPLLNSLRRKPGRPASSSAATNGGREEGEVKWFNVSKGFGFIRRPSGEEIFVHFRSIRGNNKERRGLRDGQLVSYEVVNSDKGPQAEEVEALH